MALLVRTCLKKNFLGKKLVDITCNDLCQLKIVTMVSVAFFQCHCYHTSPLLSLRRKDEVKLKVEKAKREMVRQIVDEKKGKKILEVWRLMTPQELADAASRTIENVLDALRLSDRDIDFYPWSPIKNTKTLATAVKKLGCAPLFVPDPKSQTAEVNVKEKDILQRLPLDPSVLVKRRPVVTVMGHVDHGKTTLLDTLRNTSVVQSEFGGITQHIGAFNVVLDTGEYITFLDTPGHAAFSSMRSRGAHSTDIVILVVAADDGVMEQTIQSIEMARDAKVPIIVAINKIDKPSADITRTENMLLEQGIHVENLGGNVQSVNISALENLNLNQLMDAVMAQAEVMDLKGDPIGPVEGVVIESSNDPGRGKLATALVQRGTLKKGDIIVAGLAMARVRSMFDHAGNLLKKASLSDAVQIIGWRELPQAGDEILQVENEKKAQMVIRDRAQEKSLDKSLEQSKYAQEKLEKHLVEYQEQLKLKRSLGMMYLPGRKRKKEVEPDDGTPKINIIIKADVAGSIEAILDTLETYNSDKKCRLNIVHYGVGAPTDTDVELAEIFNAIIYCFNIKGSKTMNKDLVGVVDVRQYNIIYRMIDDLKEEITKKLPQTTVETVIGEADVLQEFEINEKKKKVKVAGCFCTKGELKKLSNYRLVRNNEVLYDGKLLSMKHMKQEVTSIKNGKECGLRIEDPAIAFQRGDKLICYTTHREKSKLYWNPGF